MLSLARMSAPVLLAVPFLAAPGETVIVPFSVMNTRDQPVTGMDKDPSLRFRLKEDGKRLPQITVKSAAAIPLAMAFVMDVSGSTRDLGIGGDAVGGRYDGRTARPRELGFGMDSILEFFRTTITRGRDRGTIIAFNDRPWVVQDFVDDPAVLAGAVTQVDRSKVTGKTAMVDAIEMAIRRLAGFSGRRILVLASDGTDNASKAPPKSILLELERSGIMVYALPMRNARDEEDRDQVMKKMAEQTGGNTFPSTRPGNALRMIATELRSQYVLVYESGVPAANEKLHKLTIEIENPAPSGGKLRVRHRPGYYANAPGSMGSHLQNSLVP